MIIYEVKEVKENDKINYYEVTYDKDKLKEILNELEEHRYYKIGNYRNSGGGYIFRFPETDKTIRKRIYKQSYKFYTRKFVNFQLIEDSINYDKRKGYLKFDFTYISLTDLYKLIDIVLNDFNLSTMEKYPELFSNDKPCIFDYNKQVVIDRILNYIDSPELTDTPEPDKRVENQYYDYKKVSELYQKTLECFKFKLTSRKEHIDSLEQIDGVSFKSRKLINNNIK